MPVTLPSQFGPKFFLHRNIFDLHFRHVHPQSLGASFFQAWNVTYFPNPEKGLLSKGESTAEVFNRVVRSAAHQNPYTRRWLDLITNFLGMPFFSFGHKNINKKQARIEGKQAFIIHFFGWYPEKFPLAIDIIRAIFITFFNFLLILPRCVLNILKLGTELIPLFIQEVTTHVINRLIHAISLKTTPAAIKFFIGIGLFFLVPIHFAFKLIHLVGRAMTSPQKSLYAAWKAGKELAGEGALGKIIGLLFCLCSLALTTFVYLVLFPITIKLALTHLPATITTGIEAILNFFAALSQLGTPISVITTPIFQVMGYFCANVGTPVVLGMAMLLGAIPGLLVILLDRIDDGIKKFSKWWKAQQAGSKKSSDELIELEKMQNQVHEAAEQPIHETLEQQARFKFKLPKPRLQVEQLQPVQKPTTVQQPSKVTQIRRTDLEHLKKLAKGSSSTAYCGTYDEKKVAVKKIKDGKKASHEAAILARLQSPYVVDFHAVCYKRNHWFLIMEYMPRGSLYEFLQKPDCPSLNQGLYQIALDISYGLAYIHSQMIIHLDVKSGNILITDEGRAKICDFDLSRENNFQTDRELPLVKEIPHLTTLCWRAPELFNSSAKITEKADVYSYGVVLWELVAKKTPFHEVKNLDCIGQLLKEEKRPTMPENTPLSMAALIGRCWAQRAEERPAMKEVAAVLEKDAQTYRPTV